MSGCRSGSPVLVLQQQLVELLCVCAAVQVVRLLQDLICPDTKHDILLSVEVHLKGTESI